MKDSIDNKNINEQLNQKELTVETLLSLMILLMYNVFPPLFETYKFHYIHESGLCMITCLVCTIIINIFYTTNFTNIVVFDSRLFFIFILPPIIFSAGYNLRRRSFFKYFFYIVLFGVVGTIISFLVIVPLTYYANYLELFSEYSGSLINLSLKEILMFASVISATDTIAALTFVKEVTDPKLFAILFGEGVVNDAVCIVLFNIINDFTITKEEFTKTTTIIIMGSFIKMFLLSFIVGSLIGILCSLFLKKLKSLNLKRTQETCIIILFAFISYTLAEQLKLSPIIALLFTGMIMSHYAFYNLSFQAREESSIVSRILSNIAEAFIFTYLGLSFLFYLKKGFSISFMILELFFIIIARFFSIFFVSFLADKLLFTKFKLQYSDQGIMSFAGTIRGAIAFGLILGINTTNRDIIISGTLVLVFVSTIFFGALMPFIIKFFKSFDSLSDKMLKKIQKMEGIEQKSFPFLHPNYQLDTQQYQQQSSKIENLKKKKKENFFIFYWKQFDEFYMKPMLVHDWPKAKIDHDRLAGKIKKIMVEEYKTLRKDSLDIEHELLDYIKQIKEPLLDSEAFEIMDKHSSNQIKPKQRIDSFKMDT